MEDPPVEYVSAVGGHSSHACPFGSAFIPVARGEPVPSMVRDFAVRLDFRLPFAILRPADLPLSGRKQMLALTRRQREVYDFISQFVDTHGYSPSFEEIAEGVALSSLATVHKHIGNLETKGLLTRDYNRARSIDLVKPKGQLKKAFAAAAAANK